MKWKTEQEKNEEIISSDVCRIVEAPSECVASVSILETRCSSARC